MSFNVPYGNRVATGSFDKTAKLWDTTNGKLISTFAGHEREVVALEFDPNSYFLATASMDNTARLWDVETGKVHSIFRGHTAELISLHFNSEGDQILTASFDNTAIVQFMINRYGMPGTER